jgi:hypothetical protein
MHAPTSTFNSRRPRNDRRRRDHDDSHDQSASHPIGVGAQALLSVGFCK